MRSRSTSSGIVATELYPNASSSAALNAEIGDCPGKYALLRPCRQAGAAGLRETLQLAAVGKEMRRGDVVIDEDPRRLAIFDPRLLRRAHRVMNEEQIVGEIGVTIYWTDAADKPRLDVTAENFRMIAGVAEDGLDKKHPIGYAVPITRCRVKLMDGLRTHGFCLTQ